LIKRLFMKNNKKIFVLDTNVLLHDPLAIFAFDEHDITIPMTVLEELDDIKARKSDVSRDARVAIRNLEDIFAKASPEAIAKGVPINQNNVKNKLGNIAIFNDVDVPITNHFIDNKCDNRILSCAIFLQNHLKTHVTLVTKDINMRLKAKGAGIKDVQDYTNDQLITDIKYLSKGFKVLEGDFWQSEVECISSEKLNCGKNQSKMVHTLSSDKLKDSFLNQYLIDEKSNFAARVISSENDMVSILDLGKNLLLNQRAWGIKPRGINQAMALEALLNPNIDLVVLTGPAGCGKTLLTMAAALEQVIENKIYDKIIVTRNTPELAESIGFLPGSEEEKMLPWLGAITDTLEVLHKNDENCEGSISYIQERANLQFKSINFMRGRSIQNTFVLLDECQNLTSAQLKTIITRCGEGTKIVCSGNLAQIDSNYLSPLTSGLTYIVESFKNFSGSAHVFLNGVERSKLASFAEKHL